MSAMRFLHSRTLCFAICSWMIVSSGCARLAAELKPPVPTTVLQPYPRHGDPDAIVFNDLPVRLFFFSQTPPEGTVVAKPVRVIFKMVAEEGGTCRDAGIGGLRKLQRVAVRQRFNAVVNIRATWEDEQLGDAQRFGCRRIGDEYRLIWEGALATIPDAPPAEKMEPEATSEPEATTEPESTSTRLRELQSLYYQGLITREEFLERRQKILDGL
jgi:hypothetical protein